MFGESFTLTERNAAEIVHASGDCMVNGKRLRGESGKCSMGLIGQVPYLHWLMYSFCSFVKEADVPILQLAETHL